MRNYHRNFSEKDIFHRPITRIIAIKPLLSYLFANPHSCTQTKLKINQVKSFPTNHMSQRNISSLRIIYVRIKARHLWSNFEFRIKTTWDGRALSTIFALTSGGFAFLVRQFSTILGFTRCGYNLINTGFKHFWRHFNKVTLIRVWESHEFRFNLILDTKGHKVWNIEIITSSWNNSVDLKINVK